MELERPGQELAIYLSLRERSRPSARVRAHASSSMRAPSPAARGLTTTSPEGEREMLREFAFVAAEKYRGAPTERERKNDIDEAEDPSPCEAGGGFRAEKKHQVDGDVDRICVAEVHRIAAHPPDPGRIDQKNDSQYRRQGSRQACRLAVCRKIRSQWSGPRDETASEYRTPQVLRTESPEL